MLPQTNEYIYLNTVHAPHYCVKEISSPHHSNNCVAYCIIFLSMYSTWRWPGQKGPKHVVETFVHTSALVGYKYICVFDFHILHIGLPSSKIHNGDDTPKVWTEICIRKHKSLINSIIKDREEHYIKTQLIHTWVLSTFQQECDGQRLEYSKINVRVI
jgi:hypothetical protein